MVDFTVKHGFQRPLIHPRAARLGSIQRQLAEQMPPCGEGMRRAVKCLHGSQMLSEETIAAMLPEEVGDGGRMFVDGGWKKMFVFFFNGIEPWDLGSILSGMW